MVFFFLNNKNNFYGFALAVAFFLAWITSTNSLYLTIQSFLLLDGKQSAIFSQRSAKVPGYVFKACSKVFCSWTDHGAGFEPCSASNCSPGAI